jgi:hypothetical protein
MLRSLTPAGRFVALLGILAVLLACVAAGYLASPRMDTAPLLTANAALRAENAALERELTRQNRTITYALDAHLLLDSMDGSESADPTGTMRADEGSVTP